ncbi:hypothetical protein Salat_1415600 [Sesamum alatum]|uniref:Uncharacterized protein n=1 Tax=Sesamum alatum TaxID=300844 RepID=A0AAE2CLE0_9LAMI|nr:hypothetical protein Salat_1415600 [Sesamum alatum]
MTLDARSHRVAATSGARSHHVAATSNVSPSGSSSAWDEVTTAGCYVSDSVVMNARIAQLSRALRGGPTSVVGGCSSEAATSDIPYVPSHASSEPTSSSPTMVAVDVVLNRFPLLQVILLPTPGRSLWRSLLRSASTLLWRLVRLRNVNASISVVSSRASVANRDPSAGAAKDATEEKENTRHLKEMVIWWRQAREELKAPSNRTAEMVGEKLDPSWAISARSSVLHSLVGQDSWELYKACLIERDQAMAFSHDLSLKCSMFRYQKSVAESKVVDLQKEISEAKQREKDVFDAKAALEAENADLKAQLHRAKEAVQQSMEDVFERGRIDGFSAGEVAGCARGVAEGREVFLCSDEYKKMTATYRLEGARDFLKTPTFKLAVDIQSAHFLNEGFDKYVSQVDYLKGFVNDFVRTRLDPSLDATLQPYPRRSCTTDHRGG